MRVLITGANGFIGRNLIAELEHRGDYTLLPFTRDNNLEDLEKFSKEADFVFHLAGVNRPKHEDEFMEGNYQFTSTLLDLLARNKNACPVMITSSIQADKQNAYGKSKKAGEDLVFAHEAKTGAKALVYRLPNVFGKWCKPNYNSAVATFCHNISRDIPIRVNDPSTMLNLVYIDDLVTEMINALEGEENRVGDYCEVPISHEAQLGEIVELLQSFKHSREELTIPNMSDGFIKKLYSTYLSYLPEDQFSYPLKMNIDHRGSFTEFIKTADRGQVSINIAKPGITKGNHWHHTKNEKFLVVSGTGVIRLRKVGSSEIIECNVSGDKLEVLDIPVGYTHNIENTGNTDMVTVMWVNEIFNPEQPDTMVLEV
ncbi:UDP-2-acetamido-2,6-beta-L-arabino-hexul-4-ose reductase [Bhargavaea beijingensis]|uniref:UDP-2-acetamido-2,6-beta-L-arabino-hexul-4-ose reductase n=1 Tax=Bhargavaea beijingensis TaxID=426756 RepID=A0A1G6Z9D7_9BACL|nr:capsular polysaccharide biosynthesis protein CapF [Bhargavaea beijingensis]SDD99210.1 UDP-2-acetamido-2,6-beta-L-arabino-hexul-4-ose reductase [Bhargavaea beijingensis]